MFIGSVSFEQISNSKDFQDALKNSTFRFHNHRYGAAHYPYELEKKLYTAMLEGDLEGIQEVSREYSAFPISVLCEGNPIRSLKNMMICNCALITRVMIQAGLEQAYAYFLSDLYINKIERLGERESLIYLNNVMIVDFMSAIKHSVISRRHVSSSLVRGAVDFIEEHLYDDVSLELAAAALHTNSSYLSRLFKQELGVSFTEYTHRSRMKKAEQLLMLTDLSIVVIAGDLGYSSQSHFTRTFKRICGLTPRQYKLQHGAEEFLA